MQKFTKAIVRQPGKNFANGITTSQLGKPDFKKALKQHEQYCNALAKCGIEVTVLEANEKYPDGCFVEDTAVVLSEAAIVAKPGDEARLGEEKAIAKILTKDKPTEEIQLPGNLDGGDIMRVENHFYIGMSARTNKDGAEQLTRFLSKHGYTVSQIAVKTVLHLKTGITYLGNNNFIAIDEFANKFPGSNVIQLEEDEFYSANCLKVNEKLLIPKGFPKTKNEILKLGYDIIEIEMTEFRKMDGGLTCLSLLY